jgi:hypothetical protein
MIVITSIFSRRLNSIRTEEFAKRSFKNIRSRDKEVTNQPTNQPTKELAP